MVGTVKREVRFFVVCGRGAFPFDMLRYDCCWPTRSEDAARLQHDNREFRNIRLSTYSPHVTLGR